MKKHAGAERTHGFLFKKRGHVYAEYLRETTLKLKAAALAKIWIQ